MSWLWDGTLAGDHLFYIYSYRILSSPLISAEAPNSSRTHIRDHLTARYKADLQYCMHLKEASFFPQLLVAVLSYGEVELRNQVFLQLWNNWWGQPFLGIRWHPVLSIEMIVPFWFQCWINSFYFHSDENAPCVKYLFHLHSAGV